MVRSMLLCLPGSKLHLTLTQPIFSSFFVFCFCIYYFFNLVLFLFFNLDLSLLLLFGKIELVVVFQLGCSSAVVVFQPIFVLIFILSKRWFPPQVVRERERVKNNFFRMIHIFRVLVEEPILHAGNLNSISSGKSCQD